MPTRAQSSAVLGEIELGSGGHACRMDSGRARIVEQAFVFCLSFWLLITGFLPPFNSLAARPPPTTNPDLSQTSPPPPASTARHDPPPASQSPAWAPRTHRSPSGGTSQGSPDPPPPR